PALGLCQLFGPECARRDASLAKTILSGPPRGEPWRNVPFPLSWRGMTRLRAPMFGTVLLCAGLTSPACTGNVKRGHALYSEGYYVEAAEVFERNERRLSEWPPDKRAAYGLYRGMTLLELGDLRGAGRWLAY